MILFKFLHFRAPGSALRHKQETPLRTILSFFQTAVRLRTQSPKRFIHHAASVFTAFLPGQAGAGSVPVTAYPKANRVKAVFRSRRLKFEPPYVRLVILFNASAFKWRTLCAVRFENLCAKLSRHEKHGVILYAQIIPGTCVSL